jgi:hypothetical protein
MKNNKLLPISLIAAALSLIAGVGYELIKQDHDRRLFERQLLQQEIKRGFDGSKYYSKYNPDPRLPY